MAPNPDSMTDPAGAVSPADAHRYAAVRRIRSIIQQSPTGIHNPYGVMVDPHGLAEKIEADNLAERDRLLSRITELEKVLGHALAGVDTLTKEKKPPTPAEFGAMIAARSRNVVHGYPDERAIRQEQYLAEHGAGGALANDED